MPVPSPEALALGRAWRLAVAFEPRRGLVGERLARSVGSSLEFQDRRAYQAGDDVRHLDWRAFARTDQLFVRQYREEIQPRLELLVDDSRSMAVTPEKAQLTVDLAALLGTSALASGFAVDVIFLGDRSERSSLERLLGEGAGFDGRSTIGASVQAASSSLRPGSLRLVLSDFLSPHDAAGLVRSLARGAGGIGLLALLGKEDAEPVVGKALRLVDAETGEHLDLVVDRELVAGYLERLRRLGEGLERECARHGGTFASVVLHGGIEELARDTLVERGILIPG